MRRAPATVIITVVLAACTGSDAPCEAPPARLEIGSPTPRAELIVEVADSVSERQRGLMGRTSLGTDRGMVFLFDGPTDGGFWMKDTLIPLSIAFWDDDERIVAILDMQPCQEEPCEIYAPGETYVGAVEANLGYFDEHGIEVGDTVRTVVSACQ